MSDYSLIEKALFSRMLVFLDDEWLAITLGGEGEGSVRLGPVETARYARNLESECSRLVILLESHGIDPESEPKR